MAHVTKETLKKLLELGHEVLEAFDRLIGSDEFDDAEYTSANPESTSGTCRICGCTDEHGCPEGCYWVEDDLCSQCSDLIEELVNNVREAEEQLENAMNNVDQIINPEDYQEGGIFGDDPEPEDIEPDDDLKYNENMCEYESMCAPEEGK